MCYLTQYLESMLSKHGIVYGFDATTELDRSFNIAAALRSACISFRRCFLDICGVETLSPPRRLQSGPSFASLALLLNCPRWPLYFNPHLRFSSLLREYSRNNEIYVPHDRNFSVQHLFVFYVKEASYSIDEKGHQLAASNCIWHRPNYGQLERKAHFSDTTVVFNGTTR